MKMSLPLRKLKGFKNDKRNLVEATNNLVVFGKGQPLQGNVDGRRLPLRTRLRSKSRTKPALVPGPDSGFDRRTKGGFTSPWASTIASRNPSRPEQIAIESKIVTGTPAEVVLTPNFTTTTTTTQFQKGKDITELIQDDLICPICGRGLEPPKFTTVPVSELMRHSFRQYQQTGNNLTKRSLEEGWGTPVGPKPVISPSDVVIVAPCGELFHRECFRDWACGVHKLKKISPRSQKSLGCISCGKEVKLSSCHEVDMGSCYSPLSTNVDKDYVIAKHMNKELQSLWPKSNSHLTKLRQEIDESKTIYSEIKSRKRKVKSELKKLTTEDLSIVMSKITDGKTLKVAIDKQEKALDFMRQESLRIMRMYLIEILRKLKRSAPSGDFSSSSVHTNPSIITHRIPPLLVPHIQEILNDDQSLHFLSRIVAPLKQSRMNEARQKLLEIEILQKYDPTLAITLNRTQTYTLLSPSDHTEAEICTDVSESASGEGRRTSTSKKMLHHIPSLSPILKSAAQSNHDTAVKPPQLREILQLIHSQLAVALSSSSQSSASKVHTPVPPSSTSSLLRKSFHSSLEVVAVSEEHLKGQTVKSIRQRPEELIPSQPESESDHQKYSEHSPSEASTRQEKKSGTVTPELLEQYQSSKHPSPEMSTQLDPPVGPEENYTGPSPSPASSSNNSTQIKVQNSGAGHQLEEILTAKQDNPNAKSSSTISYMLKIPPYSQQAHRNSQNSQMNTDDRPPKIHKVVQLTSPEESARSWSTVSDPEEKLEGILKTPISPQSENRKVVSKLGDKTPPVILSTTIQRNLEEEESQGNCVGSFCYVGGRPPEQKSSTKGNNSRTVNFIRGQAPVHSDNSLSSLPPGQVSIAIMYIIEKGDSESSQSSDGEEKETETDPTAVIQPVYLTAEKTSNYSVLLATQKSNESADSTALKEKGEETDVDVNSPLQSNLVVPNAPTPKRASSSEISSKDAFAFNFNPKSGPDNDNNVDVDINVAENFESYSKRIKSNSSGLSSSENMEVSVFYENEKVIKRGIGRKLSAK